ncbi:MAG: helix-turn-helix transcriptional regulator [Clostridia bacterium]|nr:helix-turn-helix transcriptional regulator [Clostridia bacterium]
MVNRLLALINQKGLTPYSVEKALGFGNGAIKRFSSSSPSADKIVALSDFLNVSTDYILKGKQTGNSLTEREELLIKWYRECNDKGKDLFFEVIDSIKDKYKKDISNTHLESDVG